MILETNPDEVAPILGEMKSGSLSAKAAIATGLDSDYAEHRVCITLGGVNVGIVDADGVAHYERSGRLVSEVQQLMDQ